MTKPNFTEIVCILDRSGSMTSIQDDAIGGYNSFIESQKSVPGEANVSLYLFDDKYDVVYEGKNVKDAPALTKETFVPRGQTALVDAIGKTINSTGIRLAAMKEEDRPSKVIVVILTDGRENWSREYTREAIKEMIEHQTSKYSWEFVYLGANQDAFAVGKTYGISSSGISNYDATSYGTANVMRCCASYVTSSRTGKAASMTDVSSATSNVVITQP